MYSFKKARDGTQFLIEASDLATKEVKIVWKSSDEIETHRRYKRLLKLHSQEFLNKLRNERIIKHIKGQYD